MNRRIIINGEVMTESEARRRGLRQAPSPAQQAPRGPATLFNGGGASGTNVQQPPGAPPRAGAGAEQGGITGGYQRFVRKIESQVGMEGRNVQVPAFFGLPPTEMSFVTVALIALLVLFFGLRGLVGAAIAYFFYASQKQQQQQPPHGGAPGRPANR